MALLLLRRLAIRSVPRTRTRYTYSTAWSSSTRSTVLTISIKDISSMAVTQTSQGALRTSHLAEDAPSPLIRFKISRTQHLSTIMSMPIANLMPNVIRTTNATISLQFDDRLSCPTLKTKASENQSRTSQSETPRATDSTTKKKKTTQNTSPNLAVETLSRQNPAQQQAAATLTPANSQPLHQQKPASPSPANQRNPPQQVFSGPFPVH